MTQRLIPRIAHVAALAAALFAAPTAASAATALVVNNRDDGPGSFRHAIERANDANASIDTIQFLFTVRTIYLKSTVVYTGTQPLTIFGHGATLDGSLIVVAPDFEPSDPPTTDGVALAATGGGDLAISGLTIRRAPSEGLAMLIPPGATGTVRLWLFNFEVSGNAGHGVLVNDQKVPTTPEPPDPDDPPNRPDPAGSAAGLEVTVLSSRFVENGASTAPESPSDRDGLRVNEGGDGNLTIVVRLSLARRNGADGIEVDERGPGDVMVDVVGCSLTENGRHDPTDLDDGFDIDELDAGSIVGQVVLTSANDNFEEGLDFNENDAGDLRVNLLLVEANGNREEGIDYEEDDDFAGGGHLVATMVGIKANRNGVDGGDAGLKIREKGNGDLQVQLDAVEASRNLTANEIPDPPVGGVHVREDGAGAMQAALTKVSAQHNQGHGIDFDENGGDHMAVAVARSVSSFNGGAGVRTDGSGVAALTSVLLLDNVGGPTTGNVVPTITP